MSDHAVRTLRAVAAVPLREDLCRLIEQLEPRVQMVREPELLPPMRGAADWSGDPAFRRTPAQQRRFDELVDSADALFGIPDVDPAALARTVAANPRLRWVMTTAAGGGVHGGALAEFAVFGVLAGAKDLPRLRADQDSRTWPLRWQMRQLDEMTVLIVGLGGIGSACARRFAALGATVWGTTRSGEPVEAVDRLVPLEELPSVIAEVDAVVVTLPGTTQTHHLIGAALLSRARPGLILASVGRGSVIDEAALLRALDDGTVSFAALDVFEVEPLAQDSPLWSHPRVLVSPHTAALDGREEERIARRFAAVARCCRYGRVLLTSAHGRVRREGGS